MNAEQSDMPALAPLNVDHKVSTNRVHCLRPTYICKRFNWFQEGNAEPNEAMEVDQATSSEQTG